MEAKSADEVGAHQVGGVDPSGSYDQHDPAQWPGRARYGGEYPPARNAIAQAPSSAAGASKAGSRRWMGGPRAIRTLEAFLGGSLPRNRVRAARKCYRTP